MRDWVVSLLVERIAPGIILRRTFRSVQQGGIATSREIEGLATSQADRPGGGIEPRRSGLTPLLQYGLAQSTR